MTRRRREPDSRQVLRFIAESESLVLTCDEFPELSEEKIRAMLRELADAVSPPVGTAQTRTAGKSVEAGLRVEVFADGAARGDPGPAGAGWVIRAKDKSILEEGSAFLGRRTSNEAEYEAVIHSLKAAAALGAIDVAFKTDSELLVRQINGQHQVRNERLLRLHRAAREVIQTFRRFEARQVKREENSAADTQANRAIDTATQEGRQQAT